MMRHRIFLLLLLMLTGSPARLQAESVTAPLAVPGQQQMQPAPARPSEEMEIEAPVPLPERNPMLLPAAGATLLLIGGGLLFFFLQKKRRRPQMVFQPHETALLQIAQLEKLIGDENCAAFADLLDQTLRRYLEERFGIAASKQTASELINLLTEKPEPLKAYSENLQTWLELCDLVKFAGTSLSQERMTELSTNLRTFVEATKAEAVK
jgi:hypothetical protein